MYIYIYIYIVYTYYHHYLCHYYVCCCWQCRRSRFEAWNRDINNKLDKIIEK